MGTQNESSSSGLAGHTADIHVAMPPGTELIWSLYVCVMLSRASGKVVGTLMQKPHDRTMPEFK